MLSLYPKQIQIHTHSPMHTYKHTFSETPALKDFWFDKFPKLRIFTPILSPKKPIKNWLTKLSPLYNNFLSRSYRNNETESEKMFWEKSERQTEIMKMLTIPTISVFVRFLCTGLTLQVESEISRQLLQIPISYLKYLRQQR